MIQSIDERSKGVFVISATPFLENGAIDYESADRLVEYYLSEGVHGITLLGVMGEAPKLSDSEQREFIVHMLKRVNDRIPVIVGVSNPGIRNLVDLGRYAMSHGAAGVMIAGVPGLKTDDHVYGFFSQVIEMLGEDLPVCLQDYPPATSVHLSTTVFLRLVNDFVSLKMFKHEDCPGLNKLSLLQAAPLQGHRQISILTGNGGLYVPQELKRGANGVMTGFALIGALVKVYGMFVGGKTIESEDLYDCYLPLIRHEQQLGFGLAIRKEILRRSKILSSNRTRQPGPRLTSTDIRELEHLVRRLTVKLSAAGFDIPRHLQQD